MALVDLRSMLEHARGQGYAVAVFTLDCIDELTVVIDEAERCRAPVVLGIEAVHFDHGRAELLLPALEAAARRASVPVAIQLKHGGGMAVAVAAIRLGCNALMIDSHSQDPGLAREVAAMARDCGVPVEGGMEGEAAEVYVERLKAYIDHSGIDFAVLAAPEGDAALAFQRLEQVCQKLARPVVLAEDPGFEPDQCRRLVAAGVVKVNGFAACAGGWHEERPLMPAGLRRQVARCLRLWGAAGQADSADAYCAPWAPVEHVIVFNADQRLDKAQVRAIMARGRQVLSRIPGVREVFTGEAVREGAQYRFCWLIRFAHPAVIESYRRHPDHVAFADSLFRPYAEDRISIDYQDNAAACRAVPPHVLPLEAAPGG